MPTRVSRPALVAVVIPALDEERGIARVLADLPRGAAPRSVPEGEPDASARAELPDGASPGPDEFHVRDVVVVDNGSIDATADVARRLGARVVHEPRRGYGAACLAGLAALAADPPRFVAFIDADHSDDPRELPDVLAPLLQDRADLVIGSRVLGTREPGSLTRVQEFGNRLATRLLDVLFGGHSTDLGPFRAVRWESLERLGMRDRDYGWTVEMQARALRHGLRCVEVPVAYRRRRTGRSKVAGTLRGAIGAGWKIITTILRVRLGG